MIKWTDLRFSGRSRCLGLSINDAFDCSQHPLSDTLIESTHVQLYDGLVRDHVLLCARLERADGYHGSVGGSELARHNRLQTKDGSSGHDNRINARLRHRAVSAATEHPNFEAVSRRGDPTGTGADYAGGPDHDMLAQYDAGLRKSRKQSVVDHG